MYHFDAVHMVGEGLHKNKISHDDKVIVLFTCVHTHFQQILHCYPAIYLTLERTIRMTFGISPRH